jgi:hypothetical protein
MVAQTQNKTVMKENQILVKIGSKEPKMVYNEDLMMWITEEANQIWSQYKEDKIGSKTALRMLNDAFDFEASEEI